jgi:N-methylhydantoinase A
MYRLGIDIGGTFTDFISYDADSVGATITKVPSTPSEPEQGLMNGLDEIGVDPTEISMLLHGTTVATNAVLEGTGASCGLLLTEGFEDVLELGWRDRPNLWGLEGEYESLVPRKHCHPISERTTAEGEVVEQVSAEEVRAAGEALIDEGVDAVIVSFLHSYANRENERLAAEILREFWPNEYVIESSEVLPEYREFERTSTAAITGFTQPIISTYLDNLEDRLAEDGFDDDILLMQSNGGITTSSVAKVRSANTILSGPAAGATAASHIASVTGYDDVISCDMGGTSFDVGLLPGGEPVTTQNTDLDYQRPLRVPMTDITAIGAGGGSVASVTEGGILEVGPESAGADPGPVCYGNGGEKVTITDANLAMERLNPDNPIGEGLSLDVGLTRDVIAGEIAEPLGVSVEEAAKAILDVGVNKMIGKIREVSIDEGYDPREFTLVTFGGAGPLHAGELIEKGDVPRAIVPYYPGILSAIGCVLANVRHDHVRSVNEQLTDLDMEAFHDTIATLEEDGRDLLEGGDSPIHDITVAYQGDMKYSGQTHTVSVDIPGPTPDKETIQEQFEEAYLAKYSESVDKPILIDNIKVTTIGLVEKMDLQRLVAETAETVADARKDRREVYFGERWVETPIYERERLPLGSSFEGPAVLEQGDTTTVINPGQTCSIDEYGNAIVEEVAR